MYTVCFWVDADSKSWYVLWFLLIAILDDGGFGDYGHRPCVGEIFIRHLFIIYSWVLLSSNHVREAEGVCARLLPGVFQKFPFSLMNFMLDILSSVLNS